MPRQTGPVVGLSLEIERGGEVPLHEQIELGIRDGIRAGRLGPDSRLPSTRALAAELGISRGVVTEAYSQLVAEGYLRTRQGAPVRVARGLRPARTRQPARPFHEAFAYDFHPGRPDLAGFPRDRWLRSLRRAWREAPIDAVGYPDPRGVPDLRQSLAEYLGRACGAAADPERTMVFTGFSQALSMICRWLAERGVESVAVEDPGWHSHRLIAEQAGLEVLPVAVDREGLSVEALRAGGASAAIITAAHQFPTGAALSGPRRAALIDWAEEGERLIVEDDFDSEYRYERQGLGALQGLAPERVAYIGSASKRLTPGMRLGWALLPSWLAWPLVPVKAIEDGGSEVVGQLALHDFIERGELDRHLRRTRLLYQRRREALGEALAKSLPEVRFGDAAAGLFELVELPAGLGEPELMAAAAERGVGVEGLSLHRFAAEGPQALVLGFAGQAEPAIQHGIRLLGEAAQRAAPER